MELTLLSMTSLIVAMISSTGVSGIIISGTRTTNWPSIGSQLVISGTRTTNLLSVPTLQMEAARIKPQGPYLVSPSSWTSMDTNVLLVETQKAAAKVSPSLVPTISHHLLTPRHGFSTPDPTPDVFSSDEDRPFTLQHGPVATSARGFSSSARREYIDRDVQSTPTSFATVVVFPTFAAEEEIIPKVETDARGTSTPGLRHQSWQWIKSWVKRSEEHGDGEEHDTYLVDTIPFVNRDHVHNSGTVFTNIESEDTVELSSGPFKYLITDCHPNKDDYIYFTVVSPDGSLARDFEGNKALYFIKTGWTLSYPGSLRKAIFNDPKELPGCPSGHCISKTIPGSNLRLEYVKDPDRFRAGWQSGHCGYMDDELKIVKMWVGLGKFGYLFAGARPHRLVVSFVVQQMLKTYPKLEISLICVLPIGLVPACFLLYLVLLVMRKIWTILCLFVRASLIGVKKCAAKIRLPQCFGSGGSSKPNGLSQVDEFADDYPLRPLRSSADTTTPPPSYRTREPTRVFTEAELQLNRSDRF